jgi:hypothetical protein
VILVKKVMTYLCIATALFVLSGCTSQSADVANPVAEQGYEISGGSLWYIDGNEVIEAFDENAAMPISRHPFATPLLEFFAGGVDATEYNETLGRDWLGPSKKAILVYINEIGTQGVLAWRIIAPDGFPVPDLRLFALHVGEISYLDVGSMYATDMFITDERRIVEVMSHWGSQSYTLFNIEFDADGENGRLARDFTIHVMLNEDIDGTSNEYSFIPGGLWENAISSTQDVFEGIRVGYGLDSLAFWTDFPDETEAILAMTFE